jgi:hypothetical protein
MVLEHWEDNPQAARPAVPLIDIPMMVLGSPIGSLVQSYPDIVAGSLALIGLGLSFLVLPSDEPHNGAGIF